MTTDAEVIAAINDIRHAAVVKSDGTFANTPAEAQAAKDRAEYYLRDPEFRAALQRVSQQATGSADLNGDGNFRASEVVAWAATLDTNPQHDVTLEQVRADTPQHLDRARELKPQICGCH